MERLLAQEVEVSDVGTEEQRKNGRRVPRELPA